MSLRSLRVATQLLTRLPVPSQPELTERDLSQSAWWFPLIGAAVGLLVAAVVLALHRSGALLAAAAGVALWAWVTGAIHLDGLADLADALGAAHRDRAKFLTVLADPRVGAFGVVVTVIALLLKFAALAQLLPAALPGLILIAAWARLGALAWSRWLRPLKPGRAEQLAAHLPLSAIVLWTGALLALSAVLAPVLLLAPLVIAAWAIWLNARVGGVNGDCLGAGIEVTEIALLAALAVSGASVRVAAFI